MIGKTVAGITLFGPAGIAAALIDTNPGADNPCLAALNAAHQHQQAGKTSESTQQPRWIDKTSQHLMDFGNKLNKLFGGKTTANHAHTETDTTSSGD